MKLGLNLAFNVILILVWANYFNNNGILQMTSYLQFSVSFSLICKSRERGEGRRAKEET